MTRGTAYRKLPKCFGQEEKLKECLGTEKMFECPFSHSCLDRVLSKLVADGQLKEEYNPEKGELEYTPLKKGVEQNRDFLENLWRERLDGHGILEKDSYSYRHSKFGDGDEE